MADFINTLDLISDDAATKALIERTFTEFSDNSLTTLAPYALGGFTYLTNVNLPNVTSIGNYSFVNCDELTAIELPSVTSIGQYAFAYCDKLITVNLPKVTNLDYYVFRSCSKLETIELPELTKLNTRIFNYCESLVNVILPKLESLAGVSIFEHCEKLKFIDFGTLKSLDRSDCFEYCYELDTLVLRNTTLCALNNRYLFDDTKFASGKAGGKVLVPRALIESYQTATNWSTFYAAGTCFFSPLEDWTVDGTITGAIDMNKCLIQFLNNDSTVLQTSVISRGEMPIYSGDGPFEYSESGDYFVGWVPELDVVNGDMKYTAQYTPSSYARAYLRGVSFSLGDYVNDTDQAVESSAFHGDCGYTNVTFTKAIAIEESAFSNAKIESANFPLVKHVGQGAFNQSDNLKNINLPLAESVKGFSFCDQIEHLDLPNCKSVGQNFCNWCDKLKTVNLPICEYFYGNVLEGCSALESVRLPATPPSVGGSNNLKGINSACVFYIPTGSLAAYQSHSWWKSIVNTYTFVEEDRE